MSPVVCSVDYSYLWSHLAVSIFYMMDRVVNAIDVDYQVYSASLTQIATRYTPCKTSTTKFIVVEISITVSECLDACSWQMGLRDGGYL